MEIRGRHVLVTGAGRRLGKALGEYFLQAGARLSALAYGSAAQAEKTLGPRGAQVFTADLRDVRSAETAVAKARKAQGPIDVLVHAAADFYPTPVETCTPEQFQKLSDLNFRGTFFLAQAVEGDLVSQKGCAVLLCDIHAAHPFRKFPVYCATKGAVWTLTRSLALEWAPHARVNCISPGTVLAPEYFNEEQLARAKDRTLLGRLGGPEDVVHAASFLIRNDYVTGFELKVDGGASMTPP